MKWISPCLFSGHNSDAAQEGHQDIVKFLLEKGADVNATMKDGRSALYKASKNGHTEVVRLLLEAADIEVNAKDNTVASPLYMASQEGHTEVVTLLLEATDIDINAKDEVRAQNALQREWGNFPFAN